MKRLAGSVLRQRGWQFLGDIPRKGKIVIAGAPHTTNWDFILFLGALDHFKIKIGFIGKAGLFRWPFGAMFRRWGGIPVDRDTASGLVRQVADAMEAAGDMVLVIAPEGTRKAVPYWKAGFLRIAQAADARIQFASVDYPRKLVEISAPIDPHDGAAVMSTARAFFAGKQGLRPEGGGPVRLKEEIPA
jgi:1-acyl-sn-glycerol-3-phosphate acyltransferase